MRFSIVILAAGLLAGCASEQQPPQQASIDDSAQLASAALAFDPPMTLNQPEIALNRSNRGPAAFYGYQDAQTSYSYTQTFDRQTTDNTDRYQKESYVEQVGTTRR